MRAKHGRKTPEEAIDSGNNSLMNVSLYQYCTIWPNRSWVSYIAVWFVGASLGSEPPDLLAANTWRRGHSKYGNKVEYTLS